MTITNNQPSLGVPFVCEVMRAPKSHQPGSDPGLGIESQMQSLFSREIGTAPVAVIKTNSEKRFRWTAPTNYIYIYIFVYMYVHMYVYLLLMIYLLICLFSLLVITKSMYIVNIYIYIYAYLNINIYRYR